MQRGGGTDGLFGVYSQDSIADAEAAIKNKGSRIVVEKGQIVKVSKDANGIVNREVLTRAMDGLD